MGGSPKVDPEAVDALLVEKKIDGGVAEAIEVEPDGSASWIVGIQWHPELEFTDDDQNRLFAEFIDQARGARTPATPGRKE